MTELLAGRYQLHGILGAGGMGEVHRAYDTHLRRDVALKLFPDTADDTARRRFDNEIHLLARLSHPNLVTVYDASTTGSTPFVALRLVEGPTLRACINEAPLTIAQVRAVGAEIADALAHVHAQGVVHRDVKPANILLDRQGTAYLADFGLARLTDSTRLTRHDELVGTAAYLAPEQVRGSETGPPADVYALGLVLLECLTGHREYEGTEIESAIARLNRRPHIPDTLPAELTRLLQLMTSLTPRRRPTAADCAEILRGGGTVTLPDPGPDADDPDSAPTAVVPLRRHRTAKRVLTAAAVGALSLAGFSLTGSFGAEPATSSPSEPAPGPATAPQQPVQQQPSPAAQQQVIIHTSTVVVTAPAAPPAPAPAPAAVHGRSGKGPEVGPTPGPGIGPGAGPGPGPDDDAGKGRKSPGREQDD